MTEILIIGVGNTLRGDDGIGMVLVEHLAEQPVERGVRVLPVRQLTPELALDVSQARAVVFVDAAVDVGPGEVVESIVTADAQASLTGHHLGPDSLLALAQALYGRCPWARLVRIGITQTALGRGLSPELTAKVPVLVRQVQALARALSCGGV